MAFCNAMPVTRSSDDEGQFPPHQLKMGQKSHNIGSIGNCRIPNSIGLLTTHINPAAQILLATSRKAIRVDITAPLIQTLFKLQSFTRIMLDKSSSSSVTNHDVMRPQNCLLASIHFISVPLLDF